MLKKFYFSCFLFLLFFPKLILACEISQIAFVNLKQIDSEKISLTIQAQDSQGQSCKASAKIDLLLETSGLGSFAREDGSAFTLRYIGTNQANRNLFYFNYDLNDSLSVTATPINSSETFFAEINLKEALTTISDESTTSEDNHSEIISSGEPLSSHSQPTILVAEKAKASLAIGAGRPRLGVVDSPIIFRAESILEQNLVEAIDYYWTFGDGGSLVGAEVEYYYSYPGEYQVVLNCRSGTQLSVARTTVQIVEPELSISEFSPKDDYFILKNNGTTEINLGQWSLANGNSKFVFPIDTIIGAGAELSLSLSRLNLSGSGNLTLFNSRNLLVFDYLADLIQSLSEPDLAEEVLPSPLILEPVLNNLEAVTIIPEESPPPMLVEEAIEPKVISSEVLKKNEFPEMRKLPKKPWWQRLLFWY